MKYRLLNCAAVLALASAVPATAATVTQVFTTTYNTTQSVFGSSSSSAFDFSVDLGVVDFNANADSGTVTSQARSNHVFKFSDQLTLSQAATARFNHGVTGLRSSFSTSYGATASATANIGGFSFDIIDEGASVSTSRGTTAVSFGQTISDTGNDALVGRQIGIPVGFSPVVAATVNLEQRSAQTINQITGFITAVHESGAVVRKSYSFNAFSSDLFDLDLGLLGTWNLFADGRDAFGTFDADFGTSSTGIVGYQVGIFCDDVTDPDDGFGCVSEGYSSITTPVAYVKNGTPFGLNFSPSAQSQALGSITVVSDPVAPPSVVPLPAGAWLLLTGFGATALVRRRRRKTA